MGDDASGSSGRAVDQDQQALTQDLAAAAASFQAGRLEEAERLCLSVVARQANHPAAWYLLGLVTMKGGRVAAAVAAFRESIARNTDSWMGLNLSAAALGELGELEDAVTAFRRSAVLEPTFAATHNDLGAALTRLGRYAEAIDAFEKAAALAPGVAAVHCHIAFALRETGRLDEAMAHLREAVRLEPGLADAHNALGDLLRVVGRLDDAIHSYDRALEADPSFHQAASSRLFALHRHPDYDSARLLAEHRRWNERYAKPLARLVLPLRNDADPERRLRIGYLSPQILPNPVARFLSPLLSHHDRRRYEVVWYAGVAMPDDVRLRPCVDAWKPIVGLPDEDVAAMVRADGIDILVDLSMHIGGNRLLVFARRPAPVQVTYLAYCSTTGMDAMDYRITDPYLDPPGQGDEHYSERSIRLPRTFWCYPPNDDALDCGVPPSSVSGHVTFGCLNAFSKLASPALALWCRLLGRVPESRLVLHAPEGGHRQDVARTMAEHGLDPRRVELVGLSPTETYLASYRGIDVALDPFPTGGGTTTCDALWMGVPVISLRGRTAVGRAGASLLSNVGLPELVASTPDDYLEKASALSADRQRLAGLRANLRDRMRRSPLMNAPDFARDMEDAYRQMWRRWCESRA